MPDTNYLDELANELLENLSSHAIRAADKYRYYNADQELKDFGISLPAKMIKAKPGIGWATRAVNTLSDRLKFDGFANDTIGINNKMITNGGYDVLGRAKTDAIIAGCAFVAISGDNLIAFTATEATGVIDERTGMLKYGVAVEEWSDNINRKQSNWLNVGLIPKRYTLFLDNMTVKFVDKQIVEIIPNFTGRPLLHVITHRQSADRPFGKARVSNTVRRIVDEVGRLKVRYEIAAEFYSTPQRYINGLAEGAEKNPELDSVIGKIWAINKDEDGEKPEIGQLAQMSISQFSEQKKDLARDFCAETALTLRNLGYETSNPTSAESLKSMSDDLLLEAQECEDEFGREFKQIISTYLMSESGISEIPATIDGLRPAWKPIFQLDLGAAGDAVYKLLDVMPELAGTTTAYRMLGISTIEAEELSKKRSSFRSTEITLPTKRKASINE